MRVWGQLRMWMRGQRAYDLHRLLRSEKQLQSPISQQLRWCLSSWSLFIIYRVRCPGVRGVPVTFLLHAGLAVSAPSNLAIFQRQPS